VPETLDPVTRHHIDQAANRLAEEFAGIFSQKTIARYMAESTDLFGEAKINVFVPVLAQFLYPLIDLVPDPPNALEVLPCRVV
jgi:hypothetical protein